MSRLLHLGTLVTILVTLAACSSGGIYEKLGVDTTIPFDDQPPQASERNPDIEDGAIDAANAHEDVDYRWAAITTDWAVQRAADAAGNMNIVGRTRDVWAGGVATKKHHNGLWNEGDCVYKLMSAQQEHQGGGNYGSTQFVFQVHGNTYFRLPCETDEQLEAAAAEGYDADGPAQTEQADTAEPVDQDPSPDAATPEESSSDDEDSAEAEADAPVEQ